MKGGVPQSMLTEPILLYFASSRYRECVWCWRWVNGYQGRGLDGLLYSLYTSCADCFPCQKKHYLSSTGSFWKEWILYFYKTRLFPLLLSSLNGWVRFVLCILHGPLARREREVRCPTPLLKFYGAKSVICIKSWQVKEGSLLAWGSQSQAVALPWCTV